VISRPPTVRTAEPQWRGGPMNPPTQRRHPAYAIRMDTRPWTQTRPRARGWATTRC